MYQAAVLNKSRVNPYLADQILNASPEQLLLKAYDYAVVHAEKKDMIKTNRALQVLIGFLRFDDESYIELSYRLLRLFDNFMEINLPKIFWRRKYILIVIVVPISSHTKNTARGYIHVLHLEENGDDSMLQRCVAPRLIDEPLEIHRPL